ncbi:MAG: pyridoxal-dependent decarboxylase, partial [Pyrinomonadaceae bacterium]
MKPLLEDAAQRAISYLDALNDRSVAPSAEAISRLAILDEPLPTKPTPAAEILRLLDEVCSPATMAMAGPRFFGFVIGGSLPASLAANWLAGAWDQNTGLYSPTPGTSQLEQIALDWMLDLFKLPPECGG